MLEISKTGAGNGAAIEKNKGFLKSRHLQKEKYNFAQQTAGFTENIVNVVLMLRFGFQTRKVKTTRFEKLPSSFFRIHQQKPPDKSKSVAVLLPVCSVPLYVSTLKSQTLCDRINLPFCCSAYN